MGKVLQRVYKYGGQPFVRDYLAKNHGTEFDRAFGAKTGKAMMHSLAGRSVAPNCYTVIVTDNLGLA
jgi:hypothetical protein